ncbi:MAG: CPBP family intramembrane metalloprotease [Saccharofermentans sp.]|nr:CPBP family intramembrane metalloprotease [Saccharofermentans sp.]
MDSVEKKKLWIFVAIAYGVTAIMSIFMYIGLRKEIDITAFVNVQMMYPACGVIIGKLVSRKDGGKLPMGGYITTLVTTVIMMICALMSLFIRLDPIDMGEAGGGQIDAWNLISQFPLMIGGVVAYVFFWVCGKEASENAGIRRKNIKMSIILIAVFLMLYLGRTFSSIFLSDLINGDSANWDAMKEVFTKPVTYITAISLPINFFFAFIAFFGEEYGWRYYLQPVMQSKFGKRLGVIILGLVWAVWHINIDFMFYTKDTQIQMFVGQIITCLSIGIFFGYAYMKTQNIWVPVIMHFLNNNLIAVLAAGDTSVLSNQSVSWIEIPLHLLTSLLFIAFIFAPVYGKKKTSKAEDGIEVR